MIGAPLALLGLLAIAVPIVIHLLGRHQSRIERFPSLRFIGTSRLNPTKRRRISDLPLLLLRIAIVAIAALALSQPFLGEAAQSSAATSRVLIIDTSASVARVPTDTIAADVRVETHEPGRAIDRAVAWLATRPGAREIVIVSDFQRASIDTADLSSIPIEVGVAVIPRGPRDLHLGQVQTGHSARDDINTAVTSVDIAAADASWRAIGRARPADSAGRIAIIYRGAPAPVARRIDSAWMARTVAELQRDATLREATRGAGAAAPDSLDRIVPGIDAATDGSRLLLFVRGDPAGLPSGALNQALVRLTSDAIPASELDTARMSAAELARFQRAVTPAAGTRENASHARWFWLACLALIGVEAWMRRRLAQPVPA